MIRKVYSLCRRHARTAGDPVQNPDARSQARGDEPCRVGASVPSSRYWPVQSLLQRGVPANEPTPRRARRSLPRAHSLVPYVLSKQQTDLDIICDRGACNCRRSESAEAEQRMIGPALQEPEAVTPLPQHPLLCLGGSLHLIRVLDPPRYFITEGVFVTRTNSGPPSSASREGSVAQFRSLAPLTSYCASPANHAALTTPSKAPVLFRRFVADQMMRWLWPFMTTHPATTSHGI
jgi:hypothetical protein